MIWFPQGIWPCVEAFLRNMPKASSYCRMRILLNICNEDFPWVHEKVAKPERPMLLQICLVHGASASAIHIESKAPSKLQWTHNSGKGPLGSEWEHMSYKPLWSFASMHTGESLNTRLLCILLITFLSSILHRSFSSRIQEGKIWHILGASVTHGEISVITNPGTTPYWKSRKANLFPLAFFYCM